MATQTQINELKKKYKLLGMKWTKKDEQHAKKQTWRKPQTKKYKGILVDKRLDARVLDILNSNKNINIKGVCSGHKQRTEFEEQYIGDKPEIVLSLLKGNTKKASKKLKESTNSKIKISSSKKGKIIRIRGTHRGTPTWWRNISHAVSKL